MGEGCVRKGLFWARPIVLLFFCMSSGIVLAVSGSLAEESAAGLQMFWHAAALLLFAGLVLAPSLRRKTYSVPLQVLAVFALVCGAAGGLASLERARLPGWLDGRPCALQGVVASVSLTEPGQIWVTVTGNTEPAHVAGNETVTWARLTGRVLLVQAFDESPEVLASVEPGQRLSVSGDLSVPSGPSNPGGFDYRLYQLSKGVSGTLRNARVSVDRPAEPQVKTLLHRLRRRLYQAIVGSVPSSEAALLAGVVLGDRGSLDDGTLESFRQTGLFHVLAVSGLHVHFVLAPIEVLLKRVSRPGTRNGARALTLALYSVLTGMQPSVIRSSIMAFLPGLAVSSGRRYRGLDGLSIACLAIVVVNPLALFDPGLQLSALATLGLIALPGPSSAEQQGWWTKAAGLISATFSAQVFTLPVLASRSDWPLIAFVANPLLVPLLGMSVTAGMAGSVLVALLGQWRAARFMLLPAGSIARLSCMMVDTLCHSRAGSIPLPSLTPPQTALYYGALAVITGYWRPGFLCSVRNRPKAQTLTIALCVALGLALGEPVKPQGALRLTFIDVGQGDAVVIETPGGAALLVDSATENAARAQILPLLRRWGRRRLDSVVITHRHADHAGGVSALLEQVGTETVLCGPATTGPGDGGLVAMPTQARQISAGVIVAEKVGEDGPAFHVRVLWPGEQDAEPGTSENDMSLVLRVEMGAFSGLLMGDAGSKAEQALVAGSEELACYVLKVGHHGSGTSTSRALLDAASPHMAVISVGPNSFGHPGRSTLNRIQEHDARILRTDLDGAITIVTDGRRVKVRTTLRRESAGSWGITDVAEVPHELHGSAKTDQ